ncbi:DUF6220 domain-containing protein [Naasia sp. SYSU D00948]|uniref:DUF6220 domain-containing protein n=1 Tax=Naasia sp. SYSU D00948 TaxID=2817379 RepID=UPI001B30BA40|nr:DUF6220 domain-containing protein [Naasia sp. SYSU D00948]
MRKVFFVVTILLTAATALQIYFAAMGVFSVPDDHLFGIHATNGRIVLPILVLLTILTAALARAGKRTIWLSVIVLGLLILQTLIFIIGGMVFGIGPESTEIPLAATLFISLHGLNGLAIIALSATLMNRARRLVKTGDTGRPSAPGAAATTAPAEVNTVPRA